PAYPGISNRRRPGWSPPLPLADGLMAPIRRGPGTGHLIKRTFTYDFYVCTNASKPAGCSPSMPPKARKAAAGRLIGYARVSTEEQGTDPQTDELRTAGCTAVHEEHASGADRSRPVLARLLRDIAAGETLVVVRLDRLARSVSHLLSVIEQLEAGCCHASGRRISASLGSWPRPSASITYFAGN